MRVYLFEVDAGPETGDYWLMTSKPEEARLKMTKRLFKGTSGDVQKLARLSHKEMRLAERAAYWAAHQKRHPNE